MKINNSNNKQYQRNDIKRSSLPVNRIPDEKKKKTEKDREENAEREKGDEDIFEVTMNENFSKLMTDIKSQIQEAQRTASKIKTKRNIASNKT